MLFASSGLNGRVALATTGEERTGRCSGRILIQSYRVTRRTKEDGLKRTSRCSRPSGWRGNNDEDEPPVNGPIEKKSLAREAG
ncbi:hypothetical protein SCLCIDRAFT_1224703 [Scleroderma citrinum Foug A]|uniref:Uncharacterized protein n=1 Tax=Scleroderma citrinum Foug A TaxID=1036808 RepID=A0A0C3CRK7_9AGAM|nr:hypothetical protein SCLCIDRAFT_1224703 [Scleroderma citrinum Foug A]